MTTSTSTLSVPLEPSSEGVLRVVGTRVTLDTVAAAYYEGYSAEEIVQQYPSLKLPDVYSVLSYLLHYPDEVEQYLTSRQALRTQVQEENERRFPSDGIRERLLARRQRS